MYGISIKNLKKHTSDYLRTTPAPNNKNPKALLKKKNNNKKKPE